MTLQNLSAMIIAPNVVRFKAAVGLDVGRLPRPQLAAESGLAARSSRSGTGDPAFDLILRRLAAGRYDDRPFSFEANHFRLRSTDFKGYGFCVAWSPFLRQTVKTRF